jgi:membrane protease YdiL (CAAX protease family)
VNRQSWVVGVLAIVAIGALVSLAIVRIAELDARELDRSGSSVHLATGTQALLEADVLAGDELTYELCSADTMDAARWASGMTLSLDAVDGDATEHLLDQSIDDRLLARARRGGRGACFEFFEVGPITASGHFVVSARDVTTLEGTDVRVRLMAERPLTPHDRNSVLWILLAAVAFVVALALRSPSAVEPACAEPWSVPRAVGLGLGLAIVGVLLALVQPGLSSTARAVLGGGLACGAGAASVGYRRAWSGGSAIAAVVALIELSTALSFITSPGPEMGLVAGLLLGVLEIVIAFALARSIARSSRLAALGMERPTSAILFAAGFALAPIVGAGLRIIATRALSLVPSTGEAPIEAYVSWPSGLLSFAVLSVVAPIGEEVFFRGLVFGALRGAGGAARETLAFAGAWLLFVVAHLPQTWGSWGGLLAIAIAGLGFTTLRALTGSVLVSALAHLVYNGLLAAAALATP